MRSKILIALAATAIGMSSCEWFAPNKKTFQAFNLQGKWKIDSIVNPDTGTIASAFDVALKRKDFMIDSVPAIYNFKGNQLIVNRAGNTLNNATYNFDNKQITIKGQVDTIEHVYAFTPVNDSAFSMTSNEKTTVFFKRAK
ncbi:MAG TPA: hypothetical protein VF623_04650 [Segetibacter sp.]|jgi:hypothetical protein